MNKYLGLLLLCVGAAQARTLVVENTTTQDLHVRVKVKIVGDKGIKKGSVKLDVPAGQSIPVDLTTATKWVRSETERDAHRPDKGVKVCAELIAPAVGAISFIELVKVKAVSLTDKSVKGRVKILGKKIMLRKDLVAASRIAIEQKKDGKLQFMPVAYKP